MKQFRRTGQTTTYQVGDVWKKMIVVKRFETEDGKTHEFTTMNHENIGAAAVIALTPDNQVITSHQFRAGRETWCYDLPGGGLEPGEDPQDGALRELREETGYVSQGSVLPLGHYSWDAYNNITSYYFLAMDCVEDPHGTERDKTEIDQGLEIALVTIPQLIENARHDMMTDAAAVLMAYDDLRRIMNQGKEQ